MVLHISRMRRNVNRKIYNDWKNVSVNLHKTTQYNRWKSQIEILLSVLIFEQHVRNIVCLTGKVLMLNIT